MEAAAALGGSGLPGALIVLILLVLVLLLAAALHRSAPRETLVAPQDGPRANGHARPEEPRKAKPAARARREKQRQHSFAHRLLVAALKGHSSPVTCLDFSSNGKYLASCSEDRTVRLWSTRDLAGREHRCLRANVGLDHAELVRLSPDSRAFIVWLANAETIRVYKMTKKDDGSFTFTATSGDFPKKHKAPVINIGIAETGMLLQRGLVSILRGSLFSGPPVSL